ncbi:MAG: BlaI/MecI/CopY family transcriptional regulator [Gemmataceae bacterium]|nr:BlaI/MecI/CopY family transcriptional regulator [Gemmataceae bacterium]
MTELPSPTSREQEILKVLWSTGPSSVREVHRLLQEAVGEELAFNTVQTLLRIMETKKLVTHRSEGRSFIYEPVFSREESATRFLDRVFDGAASQLVECLLTAERISPGELAQMESLIAQARKRQKHPRTKGEGAS